MTVTRAASIRAKGVFRSNPVRLVPAAFLAAVLLGTVLLMLPISRTDPGAELVMPALFTATSAVCVTGLVTVDTQTFWTPFGQVVILALIQVGGFGIMTLSTLLALLVRRRLGVRTQLVAASESRTLNIGDVRTVLLRVAQIMFGVQAAVASVLAVRFWIAYDHQPLLALWHGVFHSISAFNNAGFSTFSENLIAYADDPWIIVPICLAIVIGGIGFPVLIELLRRPQTRRVWTVHLRLTLWGTLVLLVLGFAGFAAFEWNRTETIGAMPPAEKLLVVLGLTVFPRTAGFNNIDYGNASSESLLLTDVLMFIGGGSAGTAGGIKISTFLVLAFAIWTEVRGHDQVTIGPRALSFAAMRQALSVALLGIAAVIAGTFALLVLTDHSFQAVLFESISAFATVGLTTGITGDLGAVPQLILIALMFLGRVGTITVATALALHTAGRLFRLPEERPIIG